MTTVATAAQPDPLIARARRPLRRGRAGAHRARPRPGRRLLARRGRRPRRARRVRPRPLRRRPGGARRALRASRVRPRVARRPLERDRARLEGALRPRASARSCRSTRSWPPTTPGPTSRRPLRQPARLRRPAQLPAHDARAAARRGRGLVAPAVGRGARSRSASRSASPPRSTRRSRRPPRTPRATSPATTSGCTTWSTPSGERLFPPELRLLEHWNLRDEIKASYSDPTAAVSPKQRTIQRVMERIVDQSIPQAVIDNPRVDWNPVHERRARPRGGDADDGGGRDAAGDVRAPRRSPTPATRTILATFRAARRVDPYSPTAPTLHRPPLRRGPRSCPRRACARCSSRCSPRRSPRAWRDAHRAAPRPAARAVRHLVQRLPPARRLHRGRARRPGARSAIRPPRPTTRTCRACSRELGFTARARRLPRRRNIVVDPARGSGHALRRAAPRRQPAPAHPRRPRRHGLQGLQHRGPRDGAQRRADLLAQRRRPHAAARRARTPPSPKRSPSSSRPTTSSCSGSPSPTRGEPRLETLNDFWGTYEIAGVALVDMAMWHWMYDHPDATPGELRDAVVADRQGRLEPLLRAGLRRARRRAARRLLAHGRQLPLPARLPDRPPDRLPDRGADRRRAATSAPSSSGWRRCGSVTPDLWMKHATGAPVGAEALLEATAAALAGLR